MSVVAAAGPPAIGVTRGPRFHALRVRRVVVETPDASSYVLDVPDELRDAFRYRAGQFCTFRIERDGQRLLRSYSMSSSPDVDDELQVTVKRVPGGAVSNWLLDHIAPGDVLELTPPAGVFCLGDGDGDLVAFAGGSGITPVLSLAKSALATTSRRVRLLYANRGPDGVIFGEALDRLVSDHPERLHVVHHLDAGQGLVTADEVHSFLGEGASGGVDAAVADAAFYLCGPQPFMDLVESTLLSLGAGHGQINVERFGPLVSVEPEPEPGQDAGVGDPGRRTTGPDGDGAHHGAVGRDDTVENSVTVELDGRRATGTHRPGATILQTARQLGLSPPFSCEAGNCATCMAKLASGTATMRANNALTEEEVDEGWVLTCQAVPTSSVEVVYGYE